jgi:hypothetical protein
MTLLNDLPTELLIMILEYLNINDLNKTKKIICLKECSEHVIKKCRFDHIIVKCETDPKCGGTKGVSSRQLLFISHPGFKKIKITENWKIFGNSSEIKYFLERYQYLYPTYKFYYSINNDVIKGKPLWSC